MNGMQLKHRRDHASKEEIFRFKQEKAIEAYNKWFSIFEIALGKRYTPKNGRYLSSKSHEYKELEDLIEESQKQMDYLNNKYLAPHVKD